MNWEQIRIDCTNIDPEQLEEILWGLGAESVSFEDAADNPIFEPAPGTTPLWAATQLIGLFEEGCDRAWISEQITQQLGLTHPLVYQFETLAERNWERAWLDTFKPMQFGDRLWIIPSGFEPIDRNAINLDLDPGLAFGTGTHPTTALCLEWLDGHDIRDLNVVDYGCGSGVLALAALKLGAQKVWAVDNDPQALEATQANLEKNGIDPNRYELFLPDELPPLSVDLVLANILANILCDLAPKLAELSNNTLVLSGVLDTQEDQVRHCFRDFFQLNEPLQRDEWICMQGSNIHGNERTVFNKPASESTNPNLRT